MVKTDLIAALAQAAWQGQTSTARSLVRQLHAAPHTPDALRTRLDAVMRKPSLASDGQLVSLSPDAQNVVTPVTATRDWDSVIVPEDVREILTDLIAEAQAVDALARYGLAPRNRLLLTGAPGTGKTTVAEVVAHALQKPLLVCHYGRLVDSMMGATGAKIAKLFESLQGVSCVLLVDELETLLAERQAKNDVGEQARIVSGFLMAIDRMAPSIFLVGTTNHPDMLDRAVRRRFDVIVDLPETLTPEDVVWLAESLARRHPGVPFMDWVADMAPNQNGAALEQLFISRARRWARTQEAAQGARRRVPNRARGGQARTAALSPERRAEIARQGGKARWRPLDGDSSPYSDDDS